MAQLLRPSAEQVVRIRPFFPKEWGGKRVDDRKVLCSIIHGTRSSLRWGMPRRPMIPTKPSTTVAATAQTRVFLI